jgi:hypothetical protein
MSPLLVVATPIGKRRSSPIFIVSLAGKGGNILDTVPAKTKSVFWYKKQKHAKNGHLYTVSNKSGITSNANKISIMEAGDVFTK